ncbi:MAG: hypothetical protein VR64_01855 [Desulfatitalea sp. BRH_c12]|nr:MAG: hypothetical protein VR64_01855 [Desulfatitalea sp. BRH_c12]
MAKGIRRRQFLKWMGWGSVAFATGCGPELPDLIPYVRPPEGILPGIATVFATVCRECPAGCGMLAANRDGRIIKAEGNPLHPINTGKLCPRGQASLTGLYNPDRIRGPRLRSREGALQLIDRAQAETLLYEKVRALRRQGRQERVALLTPLLAGTLKEVIDDGLAQFGAGPRAHLMYEPLSYESLQAANQTVFGHAALPTYTIDQADFLISFNADFLETWLSNVEYARRFAAFHQPGAGRKNFFVYVGPRQSLTAANADHAVFTAPGKEYLVAVGMLKILLEEQPAHWSRSQREQVQQAIGDHTARSAAEGSGVSEETLRAIARRFAQAARPLALAGGNGRLMPNAYATAVAANLLCAVTQESLTLIDFQQPHALGAAASMADMQVFSDRLRDKEIDLLLLCDVNPAFTLPMAWQVSESLGKVPMVVSFSSFPDETSVHAHLHLPAHTFLETWGDYHPKPGIMSLMQPTMGAVFDTRPLGDMLIETFFERDTDPMPTYAQRLRSAWRKHAERSEAPNSFRRFWIQSLRQGVRRPDEKGRTAARLSAEAPGDTIFAAPPQPPGAGTFAAIMYPTIQFYDGRMANRPWLQELPDPITQITWGGWVEMHPQDADRLGLSQSDMVRIVSPDGAIDVPVLPMYSVPPGQLAVPIGQGHVRFGRFADGLPANAFTLLPSGIDPHGTLAGATFTVTIQRLPDRFGIAATSGSFTDHGRDFLAHEDFEHHKEKVAAGHKPHITPPLPDGYHKEIDFYGPHQHAEYRWAMIVDLDRCIGCGACVVACYAENNVAFVGREQMLKMREMSWIRAQRYFDRDTHRAGWLVMLCQHCDSAPCEAVCPVFAPHHSPEGLNNQVYNRCFGTRFCSQNDPYKVRRFNWFTWTRPKPLEMQLNPDVTVRQKGIMEKCSFCIQRIVAAKVTARNEDRPLRDGEFTTACAQTCPTDALIFGNLLDPQSRVAKLMQDARAYQVLHHLNTKPAVIYLKRLTQTL